MMDRDLTEEEQMMFSVLYGSFFALALSSDYLDALKPVVEIRGNKYVYNKVKAAEAANDALLAVIRREFTKTMSEQNKAITLKAIDDQKNFVYQIFMLDPDDQVRVKGLIKKLLKDKI